MLKSRFKSIGGNENLVKKLMQSPEISTKPKLSTLEDPYKEFTENLIRPNSSINPQIKRISRNIRPNSSTINTKMKFSFGDTANNEMMSPPNLTKERLSMIARSDTINLEENLAISGMSPKTRVSIFETYKPTITEKEKKAELTEKEKNERNFQNLLLRRREKKKMIGRFDKFFVKCDMEALLQGDETKNIDEDFKKFMREYEKMQYTANKNIERFNLYSSDSNFNQLRAQVKFKKKLIDYLLDRVADKQDLLSVYNKNVMMEDNINKNKNVIKDSKR